MLSYSQFLGEKKHEDEAIKLELKNITTYVFCRLKKHRTILMQKKKLSSGWLGLTFKKCTNPQWCKDISYMRLGEKVQADRRRERSVSQIAQSMSTMSYWTRNMESKYHGQRYLASFDVPPPIMYYPLLPKCRILKE